MYITRTQFTFVLALYYLTVRSQLQGMKLSPTSDYGIQVWVFTSPWALQIQWVSLSGIFLSHITSKIFLYFHPCYTWVQRLTFPSITSSFCIMNLRYLNVRLVILYILQCSPLKLRFVSCYTCIPCTMFYL